MAEMKEIENIFYDELGISDSSFRLSGDQAECDAQVKAACERAATRLNQLEWSLDFTYSVSNDLTGEVIYEYKYQVPNETPDSSL